MLNRSHLRQIIAASLARSRGVVLVGPRQSGKSTVARSFVQTPQTHYFDLEYPPHALRLRQPELALESLHGLIVIDEVQRQPDLFPLLRVLMDRSNAPGQFMLLGSASPQLQRQSGESLLGRVEALEISGFDLQEVIEQRGAWLASDLKKLWLRGGFPLSYLAANDADSMVWRRQAMSAHLQIDLPQLGTNASLPLLWRFWTMLAHQHGQIWNASHYAKSLGVSEPTVRHYLDLLTQTMMLRQLPPWHENLKKRQVKSPKVYVRDAGHLHALLGIENYVQLMQHPSSGASWEGFALEQVLRLSKPDEAYFWATHQGAELDLLMLKGPRRIGVEFKRSLSPSLTLSMRIAMTDLKLDAMYVVYPGEERFRISAEVEAVPLWSLLLTDTLGATA